MPPKRRKFESTFPAARIKKIMQLDDDVGRVASSVPVVISRAVEIFLQALLTRGADYAGTRNAKTLTVGHLKHCIEQEKQWDFLRELTSKISAVAAQEDNEEATAPKRGRKRKTSPSLTTSTGPTRKKRGKAAKSGTATPDGEEGSGSSNEDGGTSGTSGHLVAGRGMFSQYFNQPSTSSSSSGGGNNSRSSSTAASGPSSQIKNSKHHQQPSVSSSHPPPPPSLTPLSSSSSHHPPPALIPTPDSVAALTAMTAGLHQLPGEREGNVDQEEDDYDA